MNRSKMRSRFERADLLAAGLALCSFLLVEKFSVKVWLLIMWVILRRRQPLALALITLLFGCSFLLRAPLPASAPDTQIIRVEQIKSSYVIAEAKGQRVVVYGLKQPSFGDIVRVSGTWKQLHSDHNFGQFSFDDYLAKRGVRYRISSEESETLSQGNTLRARLFRQAWQSEGKSRELLLSLIYGIQEEGSYLLSACGLHLSCEELASADSPHSFEYAKALGIHYVTFSYGGDFTKVTPEVTALCAKAGENAARNGFQFTYHNHAAEFAEYEGGHALDYIFSHTDPHQVMAELDVYWVTKGGEDPVKYIRRYASRLPQLHLKDMDREDGSFTELGNGCIDLAACIRAAEDTNCEWLIYEQDVCKRPAFESAAISLAHLNKLLNR